MYIWQIDKKSPAEVVNAVIGTGKDVGAAIIVCFDYFDTLVTRCVYPEHTKMMASSLLGFVLGRKLSGEQLYAMRRQMEKTLCEQNVSRGGDPDFNLEDLALQLYEKLDKQRQGVLDGFSRKKFVELLLSMELMLERSVQQPCRPVVEVLETARKRGLATVMISDFYLPGRYFQKMLQFHGLEKLLDHVYISADHGITKGSGRLYRKVINDIDCRPQQMIMIGDNAHADIKMADEKGIQTIHVENPRQKDFYRNWQEQYQRQARKQNYEFAIQFKKNAFFPEMAITLWLFTCRLFQSLMKKGVRHVFFFSKEGELLKRLFDEFQQSLFDSEIIRTHYLIVSRKATFVASLKPLDEETFSRMFDHYRDISLRDFMLSLNMHEEPAERICRSLGLDFQTRYPDLKSQPIFKRLLQSDEFKEGYEELRQEQRNGFTAYLDSFGVDYVKEGLFIVDVGWKGSIQDNIYHILNGSVNIQGFYVGSLIATELGEKNQKTGILFSDRPKPSLFFNVYNNNRSLFEMMLGASHGSADGYFRKQELAKQPENRKQQVYTTVTGGNDEICVMVLDLPEERRLFTELIKPLQRGIVETVAACTREFMLGACRLPEDRWFARKHARMVFRPTGQEVAFFEKLYHLENFGVFEYTTFGRGQRSTWEQRWANFKGVLLHPELLESGIWPPIILRRMGVGPLRYYDGWRRSFGEFGLKW